MIKLPAQMESDLDWGSQINQAMQSNDGLLWTFDFGPKFRIHDPAFFSSCALAVEEFSKNIWPQFQGSTKGVVLYEGSIVFADRIFLSEQTEVIFEDFLSEFPPHFERELLFRLFCANILSEFLHRIASLLPEEIPIICRFDARAESDACALAQLLCKRRFEHLHLEVLGAPWVESTSKIAVSLPLDERLDVEARKKLNALFLTLKDFRVIPEELLCQHWDGVDQILALKKYTSEWGMRMLNGFQATGGEVKLSE